MEQLFHSHGWTITLESATLPDGRIAKRARATFADTVHILAFDKTQKILLLREYRPFYGAYIWMLPSGHVDKESDQQIAARRELREETGFDARKITYLWNANSTEKIKNTNYFYHAEELTHDPLPQDADELIEVHALPVKEALEKILSSAKVHMASAYGVMRYMRENNLF
jgi:ADP-ribose pyrophosphatase